MVHVNIIIIILDRKVCLARRYHNTSPFSYCKMTANCIHPLKKNAEKEFKFFVLKSSYKLQSVIDFYFACFVIVVNIPVSKMGKINKIPDAKFLKKSKGEKMMSLFQHIQHDKVVKLTRKERNKARFSIRDEEEEVDTYIIAQLFIFCNMLFYIK